MIGFATPRIMPLLEKMWADCFGDSPEYARFIFEVLQSPDRILVYFSGAGVPLGMLSFQPFALRTPESAHPAAYVYAIATLPSHRGRGISTELLQEANLRLMEQGCHASVLVPATPTLFGFYAARGYETCFHTRRARVRASLMPEPANLCTLTPASLERFQPLGDRMFGDSALYARWEPPYVRVIDRDCRYFGGGVLGVSYPGGKGYLVYYGNRDTVYIKEMAVPSEQVENALAALHKRLRAREYVLYLRPDAEIKHHSTLLPFGMVKWYDKEYKQQVARQTGRSAYIAHVLD